MTEADLAALAAQHQGLAGDPFAITKLDTLTGSPVMGADGKPVVLGYRYTYKDGTYIVLQPRPSGGSDATGTTYDVVNGGTALKQAAAPKASAAPKIYKDPGTGKVYQYDPTAKAWLTAEGLPADSSIASKAAIAQQRADAASQGADTAATRADTAAQAERDRNDVAKGNLSVAQQKELNAAARLLWQEGYKQIDQQLAADAAAGKSTLAERQQQLNELHSRVTEWLTQRGQDLSFAEGMARDTTTAMDAAIGRLVPISTLNGINQAQGQIAKQAGLPFTPEQPTPYPFDPMTAPSQIALKALAQISPAAAAAAGGDPRQAAAAPLSGTADVTTGSSFALPALGTSAPPAAPPAGAFSLRDRRQ